MKFPKDVIAFTDGASRGNPGPSAAGAVVFSRSGELLAEIKKPLGLQTNNFAEYTAMIEAMKACLSAGVRNLTIKADSQFMIRQMLGEYKVKAEGIVPLYQECKRLERQFQSVEYVHVPREENKLADKLANEALDDSSKL